MHLRRLLQRHNYTREYKTSSGRHLRSGPLEFKRRLRRTIIAASGGMSLRFNLSPPSSPKAGEGGDGEEVTHDNIRSLVKERREKSEKKLALPRGASSRRVVGRIDASEQESVVVTPQVKVDPPAVIVAKSSSSVAAAKEVKRPSVEIPPPQLRSARNSINSARPNEETSSSTTTNKTEARPTLKRMYTGKRKNQEDVTRSSAAFSLEELKARMQEARARGSFGSIKKGLGGSATEGEQQEQVGSAKLLNFLSPRASTFLSGLMSPKHREGANLSAEQGGEGGGGGGGSPVKSSKQGRQSIFGSKPLSPMASLFGAVSLFPEAAPSATALATQKSAKTSRASVSLKLLAMSNELQQNVNAMGRAKRGGGAAAGARNGRGKNVGSIYQDVQASIHMRKAQEDVRNFTRRPAIIGHYDGDEEMQRIHLPTFDSNLLSTADASSPRKLATAVKRRSSKKLRDVVADPAAAANQQRRSSACTAASGRESLVVEEEDEEKEEELVLFTLEEFVDERNPGLGKQIVEEEWSANHAKLLYLVSNFAICARTATEEEGWIRSLPLIVLMYEGIVAGALDFDYAPASTLISMDGKSRRVWLNVTQEGKAAIDDLREGKLINGLKLSTIDFQPVTAYQVSLRGLDAIAQIPQPLKDGIDKYLHTPEGRGIFPSEMLQVRYKYLDELEEYKPYMEQYNSYADEEDIEEDTDTDGFFVLEGVNSHYIRRSSITSSEDVSYVSSPYLPTCARNIRRMKRLTTNKHRAGESAVGKTNVKDNLSEAIVLSNVHAIVGEWMPFGANQIVALNERLGAHDRCQGGLYTSLVDRHPTELVFESDPGLTAVRILDFDPVRFINFEAEIHYPEAEGIVQVENFGIHISVDGSVMYGIYVEAIMHRKDDDVSLDMLSRLLVDVHQDSSTIMNDLLSKYQKALLDMVFMGDMDHRAKFNMIIADGIEPFLSAEEYMDRQDNENELKQVIGDLYNVVDVGDQGVLMLGRDGIIFAGSTASSFEQVLVSYLSMVIREQFIRMFFIRTFVLDGLLKDTRRLISTYESNPNFVAEIRAKLNEASRDIISLEALLEYLLESLENLKVPAPPKDRDGHELFKSLDISGRQRDVMNRVIDLRKLVRGARSELEILQKMRDVINNKKLEDVYKDVEGNTKYLVDASAANERASASLEVMQVVLGGTLGFAIIDRLAGGTMNMTQPAWVNDYIVAYIINFPYLWFALNMVWFIFVSTCLLKFMRYLGAKSEGALTLRRRLNRPISMDKLRDYMAHKKLEVIDTLQDVKSKIRKASWQETDDELWDGEPPKIEIQYDDMYQFMLCVVLRLNARNTNLKDYQVADRFIEIMEAAGVMTPVMVVEEKDGDEKAKEEAASEGKEMDEKGAQAEAEKKRV